MHRTTPQGFSPVNQERLPLPELESMNAAQRTAAEALINSPRKAVLGPFIPLLQTPALMESMGRTGTVLRFEGQLPPTIRELTICAVARETGNQFEWQTHAALAVKAGIAPETIEALATGSRPRLQDPAQETALDFFNELMKHHSVSDSTYARAMDCFGAAGTIELTALIAYFISVCWIMNVARTPGPAGSEVPGLTPFPC